MRADLYPLQVLLCIVAGHVNRHQGNVIAYLVEENRVPKEQTKGRKLRLNDDQRRRLATKARVLGRQALNSVVTIVTPGTLMRWHRRLIAAKRTHTSGNRVDRPGLMKKIKQLIVRHGHGEFDLGLLSYPGRAQRRGAQGGPYNRLQPFEGEWDQAST